MINDEILKQIEVDLNSIHVALSSAEVLISNSEEQLAENSGPADQLHKTSAKAKAILETAVSPAVTQFSKSIDKITSRLEEVNKQGVMLADQVGQLTSAAIAQIAEARSGVVEVLSRMTGALDDFSTEVDTIRQQFLADVEDALSDSFVSPMGEVADDMAARAAALSASLTERVEAVFISATAQADQALQNQVAEMAMPALEAVDQAITGMFEEARLSVLEGAEESTVKREMMEAILEEAEPAFEALQAALEYIRGVAGRVGVSI